VGYLALDGTTFIDSNSSVIRTRRKIRDDGCVIASLIMDKKGALVGLPMISAPGCLDHVEDKDLIDTIRDEIVEAVHKASRGGNKGRQLDESVRGVMRKAIRDALGKNRARCAHSQYVGWHARCHYPLGQYATSLAIRVRAVFRGRGAGFGVCTVSCLAHAFYQPADLLSAALHRIMPETSAVARFSLRLWLQYGRHLVDWQCATHRG